MFYKPYSYFRTSAGDDGLHPGQLQIQRIEQLVDESQYNNARSESAHLISHTLEGLRYLQTLATPPFLLPFICG